MARRPLDLRSLDDVAAEITRLRESGYTPTGNWNLSQTCFHLTQTMRVGMDGDEPRLPWAMRKVTTVVLWFARKRRWMPAGIGTLPRLTPEEFAEDDPTEIDRCLATLTEAGDFAGPLPPYPLADGMTVSSWRELMVVHSQHHLRYLEPK